MQRHPVPFAVLEVADKAVFTNAGFDIDDFSAVGGHSF